MTAARGLLFIVSAKRPDLFETLNAALRLERGVEVIYDRRASRDDRPRGERRRQKKIDDEIEEYGWAVVNVQ